MQKLEFSVDWKEQLRNRISFTSDGPGTVTPYYAAVVGNSVLKQTVEPSPADDYCGPGELRDPLGEETHRVTSHIIHTYPDKVLFLVTTHCAVYCRYCTRSRLVRKSSKPWKPAGGNFRNMEESFQWLEKHTEIRDVLVSGGDPFTLDDPVLENILSGLRKIPHIRIVRIGSKVPAVLPMRITGELCSLLRKYRVWLSLHFTHPDELTPETRAACLRLSDAGVPMVSQTVLLRGINDDSETLKELFYGLLEINVKPYYLLQCDPVAGSARFRTPVEKGIELIRSLHGNISGLAVPTYVIDAPGGGGKVPILAKEQVRFEKDRVVVTNFRGRDYFYPESSC